MKRTQNSGLGGVIRGQRAAARLTLQELATMSGVSSSHLARIETGERFPSAYVLRGIAKPLGFSEDQLFALAGYLSPPVGPETAYANPGLDPYVASVLSQESIEVQRAVTGVLTLLKSMAKSVSGEAGRGAFARTRGKQ